MQAKQDEPNVNRVAPMTPVAFEILLALADEQRHGYAVMRQIEDRTGGKMSVHPGTLYRTISRLVDEELIDELDERQDPRMDDQRRRYYAITSLGRQVAIAELSRLESQVGAARAKLLGRVS